MNIIFASDIPIVSTQPIPRLIIEPSSTWGAPNLREVWEFRDLLLSLAKRDVKLRYRQTFLGIAWVLIQPILAAGAFSFVFGVIAGMPSGKTSYFLLTFAGLLAWNVFAGTLTRSSSCLLQNSQLVSKVYFPRLVLPLSTVCSALIDFAVGLGMLVVLITIYHVVPGLRWLMMPVSLAGLLMLALGVGLTAAAMSVTYRDVQYMLPFLTQIALYASPVAYETSRVPERYRTVYYLNPLAGLLEAFRWSALGTGEIHAKAIVYGLAFSLAAFVWGAMAFRRMERRFADVI